MRAHAIAAMVMAWSALLAEGARASPTALERGRVMTPAAACAGCHSEIVREWEGSLHRRSASDPSYERALAREPLPFCRSCHAPSANPDAETPAAARDSGISCVECHGIMHAQHPREAPLGAAKAARPCASCHEFSFPSGLPFMQKTETEHQRSAFSEVSCASCHMSSAVKGTPHRDHSFTVPTEMIARALVADVARAAPTRMAFRLKPGRVGHALPTGDLFRRLVVTVDAKDEQGRVVSRARRYLARHFAQKQMPGGSHARVDFRDDRVGADLEPCFELDVGRGSHRTYEIEIAYERVLQPRSQREDDAVVEAHVPILERTVSATMPLTLRPCTKP